MIALVLALSCPAPLMQNVSQFPWNDYDRKELRYAEKRCAEIYSDSPCVKLFRKFDKQSYSVICSGEK